MRQEESYTSAESLSYFPYGVRVFTISAGLVPTVQDDRFSQGSLEDVCSETDGGSVS
jgi:hypothetical protein